MPSSFLLVLWTWYVAFTCLCLVHGHTSRGACQSSRRWGTIASFSRKRKMKPCTTPSSCCCLRTSRSTTISQDRVVLLQQWKNNAPSTSLTIVRLHHNQPIHKIFDIRGGSISYDGNTSTQEDDGEEYEEDHKNDMEEQNDDVSKSIGSQRDAADTITIHGVIHRALVFLVSFIVRLMKTSFRVIKAAIEEWDTEDVDEDVTMIVRIGRVIHKMVHVAFLTISQQEEGKASIHEKDLSKNDEDILGENQTENPITVKESVHSSPNFDMEDYLTKSYGVKTTHRNDSIKGMSRDTINTPVLGGTINDALQVARSKARLLVVLMPSDKPGKRQSTMGWDETAINSFLSMEVGAVLERRARKKHEGGSFLLWSSKVGSQEALGAMKILQAEKVNDKGQKKPLLLVVYPARAMDRYGQPSIVPKVLAQHHCSPPPSPEMMVAWLNALRKRHVKQYASMQLEGEERRLFEERRVGFKDSVQADIDRQKRIQQQERERKAKAEEDAKIQRAIQQRRVELKDALPMEPDQGDANTITIALRSPTGQTSQRRFHINTELAIVFDWVDVVFEMEREKVVLTTMNGQKTYQWGDDCQQTLISAGLGRLVAFRVTPKIEENKLLDTIIPA